MVHTWVRANNWKSAMARFCDSDVPGGYAAFLALPTTVKDKYKHASRYICSPVMLNPITAKACNRACDADRPNIANAGVIMLHARQASKNCRLSHGKASTACGCVYLSVDSTQCASQFCLCWQAFCCT